MSSKHVLTIPGRYENIKEVCAFVTDGAQTAGLAEDTIFKMELACDEACTNIIEHAYEAEDVGQITVSWQITTDAFIITLHDNGRSFDPQDIAEPESVRLTADLDPTHLRIGGLGIHFMRSLMDEIEYHFDKEQGNTLTMVKYIPSARDERSSIWQEPLPHGLWLVGISGRLDQALIPQLDDVLNNLLEKGHYRILVNLSQTSYINSGGLRCLVSAWRKARKNQGDVVLFGLRGRLVEIFNMVGFYKVFHIYDTRLEAETALRPADGA